MALDTELQLLLSGNQALSQLYRPVVFKLPTDQAQLKALLEADRSIVIHDQLQAQLRELVKSVNPGKKFTSNELEKAVSEELNGRELYAYGNWVYYPWSRTVVHLLDEAGFALVRTDRNRNKITREEQTILAGKKVGVVGLSVGQSVSLTMALERTFGEIRLADFDTLDLSNLNRIRTGARNLGLNKAVVTAREIAEIDPYLRVTCFTEGLTQANLDAFFTEGGKLDILVEECDSVDVKILARQKAKSLGIPVVMDSSDRGCLDVERFDLEPDRPILHGWIDHLDLEAAKRPMSAEEKVPYMLPITGVETLSARMKASVVELGRTISTWPQLATSVVLGGALAGDAVRRIALDQFRTSGRWHVDLEEQVADPEPAPRHSPPAPAPFAISTRELEELELALGVVPATALDLEPDLMDQLVKAGGAAPSAGNSQPWRFAWKGKRLLLFHDAARSLSCWDPDRQLARLALGACVENVVLLANTAGLDTMVGRGFDGYPSLVAEFTFHRPGTKGCEPHAWDHLAEGIADRRTYRGPGSKRPMPAALRSLLTTTGASAGLQSHWVEDEPGLQALAGIISCAERLRLMDPEGHREFFSKEIHFPGTGKRKPLEGVPATALALPPMAEAVLRVLADPKAMGLLRGWDGGQTIGMLPVLHIGSSSGMLLLSTAAEQQEEGLLKAGRAMQRLWLTANQEGWGIQPVFAPILLKRTLNGPPGRFAAPVAAAIAALFDQLSRLFSLQGEIPIALFRLADPEMDTVRSPRREIDQLLLTHPTIHT